MDVVQYFAPVDAFWEYGPGSTRFTGAFNEIADFKIKPVVIASGGRRRWLGRRIRFIYYVRACFHILGTLVSIGLASSDTVRIFFHKYRIHLDHIMSFLVM